MSKRFEIVIDEDEPPVVVEVVQGDWAFLKAAIEDDTNWDLKEAN